MREETLMELVPYVEEFPGYTTSGLAALFREEEGGYTLSHFPLTGGLAGLRLGRDYRWSPESAMKLWKETTGLEAPSLAAEIKEKS